MLETFVRKTFDTRIKLYSSETDTTEAINYEPLVEKIKEETPGELTTMRDELDPHKELISPSTQNLKALSLWVFFLICCSTFSFLLNVRLRLTFGPNNLLLKWKSLSYIIYFPLSRSIFKHEYITQIWLSLVPP